MPVLAAREENPAGKTSTLVLSHSLVDGYGGVVRSQSDLLPILVKAALEALWDLRAGVEVSNELCRQLV